LVLYILTLKLLKSRPHFKGPVPYFYAMLLSYLLTTWH
jgi:hypothetical protein